MTRLSGPEQASPGSVTRGHGRLEAWLAEQRRRKAESLIPASLRGGAVLDIGCGSWPLFLLGTEFAERYGIDRIPRRPGGDLEGRGIRLIDHDVQRDPRLPFAAERFAVVTMLAVFEHVEPGPLTDLLREVRRVLVPGGLYVFTTPAAWTGGILTALARLGLVSREEIDEHKGSYRHREIRTVLREAGFAPPGTRMGYFEAFMNTWGTARA